MNPSPVSGGGIFFEKRSRKTFLPLVPVKSVLF